MERDVKKIITLSGPSGVGKSVLTKMLLENYPDFALSVSATTRPIRDGEEDGREYYFLTVDEFQKHIDQGDFLEWEEVYEGRFYGTLTSEVDRIVSEGKKAVFDIDVLGSLSIKKIFQDDAHIVFVKPESVEALEARLRNRQTDSEEDIKERIARFELELSYEDQFDDTIVNATGELDASLKQLEAIVQNHFL